jgi:hypothetical protein
VLCHTRPLTATENKDYVGRPASHPDLSKIHFEPGEKLKICRVELIDETVLEADETFQVRLSDVRGPPSSDLLLGPFSTLTVTITNAEDAALIALSEPVYYTEEPSAPDSSVIKQITVVRTGDLSRVSLVRVSTADETAQAGVDYKPKTAVLQFNPGVAALHFEVEILPDGVKEAVESFRVVLGPQEPVAGQFGAIRQATVFIQDTGFASNQTVDTAKRPLSSTMPYINSLDTYVQSAMDVTMNSDDNLTGYASNGKPLICIQPCDPANPLHRSNQPFCETVFGKHRTAQDVRALFSWEVSSPNEFNLYSPFVKLTESSFVALVNESVLEPVYFRPKFRVRCAIKYTTNSREQELLTIKSAHVQILTPSEATGSYDHSARCMQRWQDKTTSSATTNFELNDAQLSDKSISFFYSKDMLLNPTTGAQTNSHLFNDYLKFNRPFVARADYVSAEFITNSAGAVDAEFLNYVRISVDIPFMEGFIPIISTQPLHNFRYLLNNGADSEAAAIHLCSNFVDFKKKRPLMPIKYGFIKKKKRLDEQQQHQQQNSFDGFENMDLEEEENKYRSRQTLNFYTNLDKPKCAWEFVAYYDIGELTAHCHAHILSNSDETDSAEDDDLMPGESANSKSVSGRFESDSAAAAKSHLTIRVPLYVSYLYADGQAAWLSVDYKTSVEASIIYKTKSFQVNDESMSGDNEMDIQSQLDFILNANGAGVNYNHQQQQHEQQQSSQTDVLDKLDQNLASLTVTKIGLVEHGRLSIEFATVAAFHGQFIKQHPSLPDVKSMVNSAFGDAVTDFNLDLVWSQYTYDYPEQNWRATSTSVLNVIFNFPNFIFKNNAAQI